MQFPIFEIASDREFQKLALDIYKYQRDHNPIYDTYCSHLNVGSIDSLEQIPFLPISFFKKFKISTETDTVEKEFTSSGTTGSNTSTHYLTNLSVYDQSLDVSFRSFYGNHEDYVVLALLPHYLERTGSSLVYMAQRWIDKSTNAHSGFYLDELSTLSRKLNLLKSSSKKIILIGVTFALLELAEKFPSDVSNLTIIETGGMKGLRKEIVKQELHGILRKSFPNAQIQSEYGMTELLSQAYAFNGLHFTTPSWMKVVARDTNDPLQIIDHGKTGGLNVIDLANYNSCPFVATQDLCKTHKSGTFEVLGRFDQSDVRGCNLMAVPS
ncbi:acyl transferase [Nonlabens spongiae]|uniref:Acyl transferase n=1 Tax=Nonlabens spongiae TaxID=331648 RepID=A0A1W6MM28_9FLAO|nr:acyl transferase [Nonlabens spongiae]ARN78627.1 acyl transferase [Nonlabens spongiae]